MVNFSISCMCYVDINGFEVSLTIKKCSCSIFPQFYACGNVELYVVISEKKNSPNTSMVVCTSPNISMLYVDIDYYARR